jgi:hypothetical protein
MRAKVVAGVVAVVAGSAIAAAPATAHVGHASCKAFGETVSGNAQSERPWGQIVSIGARLGLTSALTEEAHTIEGLCEVWAEARAVR